MRQLIKKVLREHTRKNLSSSIKKLLMKSVAPDYKDYICQISVIAPWERGPFITNSNFEEYEIMVRVVGGVGSKNWPMTQHIQKQRDNIVKDIEETVYNYLGVPSNVFLRNVISCEDLMREEVKEEELTERCWKGYSQKGMKTMFGKRYPNCVKIKK